jgi:DNA-binding MarR family transcriptional regulator
MHTLRVPKDFLPVYNMIAYNGKHKRFSESELVTLTNIPRHKLSTLLERMCQAGWLEKQRIMNPDEVRKRNGMYLYSLTEDA